jgi:uracil-DNA glycosylase
VSDLAEHLKYFAELGVTGVSRDPAWRARAEGTTMVTTEETTMVPTEVTTEVRTEVRTEGGTMVPAEVRPGAPTAEPGVGESPAELLAALKVEIGPLCVRCKLCELGRSQVVFGVGNPKARLMFVGEAPGEDEDRQGEPFVGRAGQLLTKIIEAISLSREQVYIANVIKCRPPGNRNPEPDEVAACEPFLFRQIAAVQPQVIVTLGKFATQCLLRTTDPITRLRGREFEYRGATLVPTFHPAYLLRNPPAKREVWEDMKKVRALLMADQRP